MNRGGNVDMDSERSKLEKIQTDLVHTGDSQNPSRGIASPVYQIATYRFDDPSEIAQAMVAEAHPEYYGRYGSLNTKQVEETLAKLEGGEAALAVCFRYGGCFPYLVELLKSWRPCCCPALFVSNDL